MLVGGGGEWGGVCTKKNMLSSNAGILAKY